MTFHVVERRYRSGFSWHKGIGAIAGATNCTARIERGYTVKFNRLARLGGLAIGIAALAACQQETAPAEPSNPDAKPGLSVDGGKLVLPAVKGNPGAAYFALSNSGDKAAELAAVYVEGAARSEMHETSGGKMAKIEKIEVQPGETIKFERGGKHVMAFELNDSIQAGGTTEMTLIFADGDKLSTPLAVESVIGATGEVANEMDGMDHGDAH